MLKLYSLTIFLVISNFSNGQVQIQKINDSCYFEIVYLHKKNKYQVTKYQNKKMLMQTLITDTSVIKSLNYMDLNSGIYYNPFIVDYVKFYNIHRNNLTSKIEVKKNKKNKIIERDIENYDSGKLVSKNKDRHRNFGWNFSYHARYYKGNKDYEEKISFFNISGKWKFYKKYYTIKQQFKYQLVKNIKWSDQSVYRLKDSNIYSIDGSEKVKLTKTKNKKEYILNYYNLNNKIFLTQHFKKVNKGKQTFRCDDNHWSYLKNSVDTFYNDSGGILNINHYSINGNLIFHQNYNLREPEYFNDLLYLKKSTDTLIALYTSSKILIFKNNKSFIKQYFDKDTLLQETIYNKAFIEYKFYQNGKLFEIYSDIDKKYFSRLKNYFRDKEIIELEDLF